MAVGRTENGPLKLSWLILGYQVPRSRKGCLLDLVAGRRPTPKLISDIMPAIQCFLHMFFQLPFSFVNSKAAMKLASDNALSLDEEMPLVDENGDDLVVDHSEILWAQADDNPDAQV